MKTLFVLCLSLGTFITAAAQQVIELPFNEMEGVKTPEAEMRYYSQSWATTAVTNVNKPTLTVYKPSEDKRNGLSVIIAPGGGLFALSINSEGQDVAQWLVSKGITAFVLKYRLVATGEDATVEVMQRFQQDQVGTMTEVRKVLKYAVEDGHNAIIHVRENAEEYGIDPNKIGFMGFSAGGAVTMGVGYTYTAESRPDYLVPVYPWTDAHPVMDPPADSPPVMIVCATDDGLGLAKGSIDLYSSYYKAKVSVALHMYAKGDHGFGMRAQGLPSDTWIERFYDWAKGQGMIE